MNEQNCDSGDPSAEDPSARRSTRIALNAEVTLRRPGHSNFKVRVYDLSQHGCKLEFVERPKLDDRVWVKFDKLEALEAVVCWADGFIGGVEFGKPLHPAVLDLLVKKAGASR